MDKLTVRDLDAAGKRVLVRVDFNVPLQDGKVTDDSRIRAALPTIRYLQAQGARVILASHLGRPDGKVSDSLRLRPVGERLGQLLGRTVPVTGDALGAGTEDAIRRLRNGEVLLLENLRFHAEEERNDPKFAEALASYCDVYVNDAFGTAHRAEATTHGIAKYAPVACAGPLLAAELEALGKALNAPARPLVAIVAGSKVSTKLTILKSLADKVDHLIVGGGIANTFMLAAGLPIGKSLAEADLVGEAKAIIDAMAARGATVPIPTDVVCAKEFSATAEATVKAAADVAADDMILDIGPQTAAKLAEQLGGAGTIVWNGPVGVFEFDQFGHGTETLARAIAAAKGFSIAGGGDTLAAIAKYGIADDVSYISTGGGAFLEFLEGKTLPAVDVLQQRAAGAH